MDCKDEARISSREKWPVRRAPFLAPSNGQTENKYPNGAMDPPLKEFALPPTGLVEGGLFAVKASGER
jgi:hypothetical protein